MHWNQLMAETKGLGLTKHCCNQDARVGYRLFFTGCLFARYAADKALPDPRSSAPPCTYHA